MKFRGAQWACNRMVIISIKWSGETLDENGIRSKS